MSAAEDRSNEAEALSRFQHQTTNLLSGVASKLQDEVNLLHLDVTHNFNSALRKEKERHLKEENRISKEISNLQTSVGTLEYNVKKKECIINNLVHRIQDQSNLILVAKYFHAWRDSLQEIKREKFLLVVADKHYCRKLKQKVLRAWFNELKLSWKQRLEIKATVDVLETQRCIVKNYESRIKNLQENLCKADRQIDYLHKSYEETVAKSLSFENQQFNVNVRSKLSVLDQYSSEVPENSMNANPCPNCHSYTSVKSFPVSFVVQTTEKTIEPPPKHPFVLPKALPVMGTAPYSYYSKTLKRPADILNAQRKPVLVECHVPRAKPSSTSNKSNSRPSSSRVQSHKKIV